MIQKPSFHVIGISIRTTNQNEQSSTDVPALWNRFFAEGILAKIPNKISNNLYCIYTDYEKDHTEPYTTLLGCQVENLNEIPEGLIGKTFPEANYEIFTAKGNLMEVAVYNEWMKIWKADISRTFVADFEIYDEKSHNPEQAEVDIFIGIG
ncbi:putative transcriptional regulator YdeE [Flavobacterium arsenatis]|uniref:Transcriptional regulator YdeE n=1 Tax=Flavobacterium arsenatis TaxID=1484332 RepID=A0ABU1TJL6_9FLAO|nr:GyrI-like domain-containing protein [Flavobacterium arsenatis]MDR6966175.1 putative transcriptional regulator YdeE [Flavobacterium arsenatis]